MGCGRVRCVIIMRGHRLSANGTGTVMMPIERPNKEKPHASPPWEISNLQYACSMKGAGSMRLAKKERIQTTPITSNAVRPTSRPAEESV